MSAERDQTPAVIHLTEAARPLAGKIAAAIGGEAIGLGARAGNAREAAMSGDGGPGVAEAIRTLFLEGRPIVALMASGALIRILAPLLADKRAEPPVVVVAEDGSAVVPLLGGHHGANDLARTVAAVTAGVAAVTTAGDVKFGLALDAPPAGYVLENPEGAKAVMAALVAGATAELEGKAPWLEQSRIPFAGAGANTPGATVKIAVSTAGRGPRP